MSVAFPIAMLLLFVVCAFVLWSEKGKTAGEVAFFVVVLGVLSAIGGLVIELASGGA